MGFLTQIRSGLVVIIFVAMALILWLTTSFWYVAYKQYNDGQQLIKTVEIQDQVINLARSLSSERTTTNTLLSSIGAASFEALSGLEVFFTQSDSMLLTTKHLVAASLKNPSESYLHESQINDISEKLNALKDKSTQLESLRNLVRTQANLPLSDVKLLARGDSYLQYTQLISAVDQLQKALKFRPGTHTKHLDHHLELWEANRRFSEALSQEVAFQRSVLVTNREMTPGELAQLEMRQHATSVAWADIERYSIVPKTDPIVTTALSGLKSRFLAEYRILQEASNLYSSLHPETFAVRLENWNQLEVQASTLLTQLDRSNSEEIRYIAEDITAEGFRNLILDTIIIFVCLIFGIAVIDVVKRIRHLSTHDVLTGLPNRMQFEAHTEQLIKNKQQDKLAVLFVDLDGFKQVNDSLGHLAGDNLLQQVSRRMEFTLNDRGTISRYGGDEFSILISKYRDKDEIVSIGNELIECLSKEFDLDGYPVFSHASIGISVFPNDATTAEDLKRNADFAMYYAKSEGKNRVCCYDQEMAAEYQQRIILKADLQKALELNQLELYYQPQVSTSASAVAGVEALIRWHHPEKGFIRPDLFIPIAEESGLIHPIGDWVLDDACRQMSIWHESGLSNLQVAINVSAHQFMRSDFIDLVESICTKYDINTTYLELEITESVLATDIQQVIKTCKQLRGMGIRVAIDDFGTGYSSLSYLQDLPADTLKIDRSFVIGLSDTGSKSVARTIVSLAESCGLETVAEGVETSAQLEMIHELGCDYVQGYYYSKPVAASEIPQRMKEIFGFCAERDGNLQSRMAG